MLTQRVLMAGLISLALGWCCHVAAEDAPPEGLPFDLQQFLDDEIDAGKTLIQIPPGRHRVTPVNRNHIYLSNLNGITIDGTGAELICTQTTRAWTFYNCTDVTLRGLTIDYDPLCYTQGEIVGISANKLTHDIRLFSGYPTDGEISASKYEIFNAETRTLRYGSYFNCTVTKTSGNTIRVVKPGRYETNYKGEQVGDIIAIGIKEAPGGSIPHAIYISQCSGMTLEDVTLYSGNSFGFFESNSNGSVYQGCAVERRPPETDLRVREDPRIRSNNADAFHSKHAQVGPQYIECRAGFQGDDCIAINGDYHMIMNGTGDTLRVLAKHDMNISVGDPVELVSYTGLRIDDAVVLSVTADGTITQAEKDFLALQSMNDSLQYNEDNALTDAFLIQIDRSINLPQGSLICSGNRIGNGFKVIDCDLGFNRSRGILVKASNGEISGNTLEGCWGSAIKLAPEYWWLEAGTSQNVVIKNNVIRNCIGRAIEVSSDGGNGEVSPAGAFQNIDIQDNLIQLCPEPQIELTSIDQLTLTGNTITYPEGETLAPEDAISITNCTNITSDIYVVNLLKEHLRGIGLNFYDDGAGSEMDVDVTVDGAGTQATSGGATAFEDLSPSADHTFTVESVAGAVAGDG